MVISRDITMHVKEIFIAYDWYYLFIQSNEFSMKNVEAFLSYFGLKTTFFTFSYRHFTDLELLNR